MAQNAMEPPRVFEGTGEEVARQIRDLEGRRVKVLVYTEEVPADSETGASDEAPRDLAEMLAPLLEKADRLEPGKPVPPTDPHEIAFGEIMRKKAERLGLKI